MVMLQILNDEPPSPRKFNAAINRDLETICLKCLEKEPERRYGRAMDLAADLKQFMVGGPISARPVGKIERAYRWCRRNVAVASLAASIVALLLVMVAGSIVYSLRLRQRAEEVRRNADEAETYFRTSLDAVDSMLREVGEESLANIPNAEPIRRSLLVQALEFQRELVRSNPSNNALRLEVARAQYRSGDIHELLGEFDESKSAYEESIRMFDQFLDANPDDVRAQFYLAISHNDLGELLRMTSPSEAERHYSHALRLQQQLEQQSPRDASYLRELNRTRNNYGLLLTETSRFEEAEVVLDLGIRSLEGLIPSLPPKSRIRGRMPRRPRTHEHQPRCLAAATIRPPFRSGGILPECDCRARSARR